MGSSDFTIRSLSTLTNIGAGNDREFIIRFNPSSLGEKTATFIINNNDPDENPYSFDLRGVGTGFPEIRVQGNRNLAPPFEIADNTTDTRAAEGTLFADTDVGSDRTSNFHIHNDGDAPLTLSTPTLTGTGASSFTVVGFSTATLAAGGEANFSVRFSPTSFGTKNATLSFANNDSNENPFNFALSGLGEAPSIRVAGHLPGEPFIDIFNGDALPREVDGTDFGEANVTSTGNGAQREFRITNSGNVNLNIQNATTITGPAASDYDISGLFAGNPFVEIKAGESQTFTITFDPTTTGDRDALVSIASNDSNEDPYTFALTGIGIGNPEIRVRGTRPLEPLVEIDDNTTSTRRAEGTLFADTNVGSSRLSNFTIYNDGDGALTFNTPTLTGTGASSFAFLNFSIAPLAPGEERDFNVRFTPTSLGIKDATLSFGNNDSDENPFNFALSGLGTGPEMEVRGGGANFSFIISDGDTNPRSVDGTLFGDINPNQGSQVVPFQICNLGDENLVISSTTVTGTNSSDFTVRELGGFLGIFNPTISPGEERVFEVVFDPTASGTRNATIQLNNNDADEDPYTFAVRGFGQDPGLTPEARVTSSDGLTIANGDTTPRAADGTDFGSLTVGDSNLTRTFNIHNDGDADLEVAGVIVNNALYTNTTPATIPEGESRTFTITLEPSLAGQQDGVVSIFTNDPTASSFTFSITADVQVADGDLAITEFEIDGDDANVTFTSIPGETYSIKKSTTLETGSWNTVPGHGDIAGSATPQTINLMDVIDPDNDPKAFFRLERNP